MKNKKLQALLENALGSAAAKPHATVARSADIMQPSLDNAKVYTADQHMQAEEVKEVIVEGIKFIVPKRLLRENPEMPAELAAQDPTSQEVAAVGEMAKKELEAEDEIAHESEHGKEGEMAKTQLRTVLDAAEELHELLHDFADLPEWVQSKLTLATEYIDSIRDYLKSESKGEELEAQEESAEEVYTDAELMEAFNILGLDTRKYNLTYLAEQLGFVREELGSVAAEPVATAEKAPKSLKISLGNDQVFTADNHKQAEDVKPVLVEGYGKGRPSEKSKRMAPKGNTVVGKKGQLEVIKNLQKKK
jgi:hypothetical protein